MKYIIAVLGVVFALAALASASPTSTNKMKDNCDAYVRVTAMPDDTKMTFEDTARVATCLAYVSGVVEESDNEIFYDDAKPTMVVGHWDENATVDQVIRIFVKYVNENPAALSKEAHSIVLRSNAAAGAYLIHSVKKGIVTSSN